MPTKKQQHTWEFTKYFRSGVYRWNGTALASKRMADAIKELKSVAVKEPAFAAEGAVKFIEKCWRALVNIDSSSGAIGRAVNNALTEAVQIIHDAPLSIKERNILIVRIWNCMQEEDYGYYDLLSEQWVALCSEPEIMTCWADTFLPTVNTLFSSNKPGGYFKGTEPCLACLFETGRHDEIVEMVQKKANTLFNFKKYVIKVIATRGDLEKALSMLAEYLSDSNTLYQAAHLGEKLLLEAGHSEEAYKRYTLKLPFQTTGLATLSAIRKKYPAISPQRILNDLIDADPGNERRYFAAARKIGMIELALEIAEKFNVEPKTLTTACKDYLEKDANLSLRFGLMALQSYASGHGYEPEYSDLQKCYNLVCTAAERTGKRKEISEFIDKLVQNDTSSRKLLTLSVRSRHLAKDN